MIRAARFIGRAVGLVLLAAATLFVLVWYWQGAIAMAVAGVGFVLWAWLAPEPKLQNNAQAVQRLCKESALSVADGWTVLERLFNTNPEAKDLDPLTIYKLLAAHVTNAHAMGKDPTQLGITLVA